MPIASELRRFFALATFTAYIALTWCSTARAIDFYEIQIYPVETEKYHRLTLEVHSNSVTTATGSEARSQIDPYQIHETLELTYGLMRWAEIGQYLCTAKLDSGNYEYSGARTKIHFAVLQTIEWPMSFGGNVELDYMRHAAEQNPLSLELRPIVESHVRGFTLTGNFAFVNPMSGSGAHHGFTLEPSGEISYDKLPWITPALEYYGDMGAIRDMPSVDHQQHFIVPAVNLKIIKNLEFNFGVGIGLTRASNGLFVKSIVGWTF
ncbi:MAG TPA: hypothetical protein VEF03_01455 [Candidatus Binataceae bacterium]|nr:hypothetical protein [Candidatus Binataceae bacterium]